MCNASKVLEVTLQRVTYLDIVMMGAFLIWFNLNEPPTDKTDLLTVGESSARCLAVVRFCSLFLVNEEFSLKNQISRDCDWGRNAI